MKIYTEKGEMKDQFSREKLDEKFPKELLATFQNILASELGSIEKSNFLEISYRYSPAYQVFLDQFSTGTFLCDDPFECMLMYHYAYLDNKELTICNYNFTEKRFSQLKYYESFNFIYSYLGLTYEQIHQLLPSIISFAAVDGIIALKIPAYWYDRENLTDDEKLILDYSKKNDKKWLFIEPLETVVEEHGAVILRKDPSESVVTVNRTEVAYLASLNKLYSSIHNNNMAQLEMCTIPENDITLRTMLLVIKKEKKTLNKDNLFNL